MKRTSLLLIALAMTAFLSAQTAESANRKWIEASNLTLTGKLFTDTSNPYHRVDTTVHKGFDKGENSMMRCSAGIAVAFKTNSTTISVKPLYGTINRPINATDIAYVGFDLYIKDDRGKWLWAGNGVKTSKHIDEPIMLVKNLDGKEHECLIYLPVFSELLSVKIGVEENSSIEAIENPFHNRIGIYGSSFTHGACCSRSGMSYPKQLERMTGYQMLSIAASGRCLMQDYFADAICASDFDAFIFDTFSNPGAKMIEERLEPFIKKIRAAHPTEPLIFQQTIYRENRNFNTGNDKKEKAKQETAARLMKELCKKYPNVYFIKPCATDKHHESSVDGIHPGDYGYTLWAESIRKDVTRILRKHGIR